MTVGAITSTAASPITVIVGAVSVMPSGWMAIDDTDLHDIEGDSFMVITIWLMAPSGPTLSVMLEVSMTI